MDPATAEIEKLVSVIPATAIGVMAGFLIGIALTPPGPSIQLVENKKQETKTVCLEKDIDWVKAYTKDNWQRLEQLPKQGVIEKDFYNLSEPSAWVTLDTQKANITPPSKVAYKAVSECIEHKQIPKYSKVKVEQ